MECRLDYITKGDYMDIDDYLKYIDQLSDKFIFKLDAYTIIIGGEKLILLNKNITFKKELILH